MLSCISNPNPLAIKLFNSAIVIIDNLDTIIVCNKYITIFNGYVFQKWLLMKLRKEELSYLVYVVSWFSHVILHLNGFRRNSRNIFNKKICSKKQYNCTQYDTYYYSHLNHIIAIKLLHGIR